MVHSRPTWSPIEMIGYVFILISFRKGGHELPSLPREKGSVLRVESLSQGKGGRPGYPLLSNCNGSTDAGLRRVESCLPLNDAVNRRETNG